VAKAVSAGAMKLMVPMTSHIPALAVLRTGNFMAPAICAPLSRPE
jgi:hypothetical protein